jgi:hypothetical protein
VRCGKGYGFQFKIRMRSRSALNTILSSTSINSVSTLRDFYELGDRVHDVKVLNEFVASHFDVPGQELVEVYPEDWVPFPNDFTRIEDYRLRRWALHLHRIWRDLCRRVMQPLSIHCQLERTFLGEFSFFPKIPVI